MHENDGISRAGEWVIGVLAPHLNARFLVRMMNGKNRDRVSLYLSNGGNCLGVYRLHEQIKG